MTAYLGPLGNLVEFKCPSSEQIVQEDNISTEWTMGGVQKAQYGPLAPRSWSVSLATATPAQIGKLTGLLRGLYGTPPWTYVGPWAQVTNLFSPVSSVLQPGGWLGSGLPGGKVTLDNGWTPEYSVVSEVGANLGMPTVPAVPGKPVTFSIWASGNPSVQLELYFRNAAGGQVGFVGVSATAPLDRPLQRVSVTGVAPAGTAVVYARVLGAHRAAMPALTWTADLADWTAGEGAPKVIARGLDKAVQLAVAGNRHMRRTGLSFELSEVGNA